MTVGLIGAPLLLAAMLATVFGAIDQVSGISFLRKLPIAAWELSVGIWIGPAQAQRALGPSTACP